MDKTQFLSWCVTKRNLKKSSMKSTRIRYNLFFKWLGRKKLSYDTVAEYALYLREKGLRNVSINTHLRVLRLIDIYEREFHSDLHLFKKTDYLPKEKRIPIILSPEEQKAILSVHVPYTNRYKQKGWEIDLNRNLVLWVITATGCRIDEALSLRRCDIAIGIDDGQILLQNREDFTVKNDLSHKVPIPGIVIDKLKDHLEKKKPTDLAFVTANGNKISHTSMEDDWHRRLALAGIIKAPHIHDLRASYIMVHLRAGTDLPYISKLVGHKDVKTTMGYMDFNDDDLNKAANNHYLFEESAKPLEILEKKLLEVKKIKDELLFKAQFLSETSKEKLRGHLESVLRELEDNKVACLPSKK